MKLKEKGFVGTKEIFNINFIFDLDDKKIKLFKDELSKKISAIVKKNVEPVLVTSYDREYFLNYNKKLRATIDTNLSVKHINNKSSIPLNKEIMEIKYNIENDDYYRNTIIDTNFNFRFQKYSKICIRHTKIEKMVLFKSNYEKKIYYWCPFFQYSDNKSRYKFSNIVKKFQNNYIGYY